MPDYCPFTLLSIVVMVTHCLTLSLRICFSGNIFPLRLHSWHVSFWVSPTNGILASPGFHDQAYVGVDLGLRAFRANSKHWLPSYAKRVPKQKIVRYWKYISNTSSINDKNSMTCARNQSNNEMADNWPIRSARILVVLEIYFYYGISIEKVKNKLLITIFVRKH